MSKARLKALRHILDLPTAPFAERQVIAYIREFVAARPALRMGTDPYGNLLVKYTPARRRKKKGGRPILFSAHMDHPGFRAAGMLDSKHVRAEWRGWVQARYFKDARIRFFVDGQWVPAVIEQVIPHPSGKGPRRATSSARSVGADSPPMAVIAKAKGVVPAGSLGMWDLPDAVIRNDCIHARGCDDTAGVAAIICTLDAICRRGAPVPCYACFTRAEEVGFAGALAAVSVGTLPRDALVVAVECSRALPSAAIGDGPVLRVGDKASIFTPAVTAYCQVAAEQLAVADRSFRFQRKLMDGGTCESTAYCHYGYDATGICLPLLNYHNMDTQSERIAPEAVGVDDFLNLVNWFIVLAGLPAKVKFDGGHPGLTKRLDALLKQHRSLLLKSAATC